MTQFKKTFMNKKLVPISFASTILFTSLIGFNLPNIEGLGPNIVSAATTTYTATDNLNIRTGPSTKNKIITTVKKGTQLTITGKISNGWLKVSIKGQTGYVSSQYVKITNSSSTTVKKPENKSNVAATIYTATDNLNIRTGPSTKNKIITTVKKGTQLTVTGKTSNGWLKVSIKGQTGYVSSQYVKITNSSSTTVKKPENKSNVAATIYTATDNLNIRTGPSTSNKIITTVKKGTQLTVTGKTSNGWLKVSIKGQTGYVSSQYVKASKSSSDTIHVVTKPESISALVNKKISSQKIMYQKT